MAKSPKLASTNATGDEMEFYVPRKSQGAWPPGALRRDGRQWLLVLKRRGLDGSGQSEPFFGGDCHHDLKLQSSRYLSFIRYSSSTVPIALDY